VGVAVAVWGGLVGVAEGGSSVGVALATAVAVGGGMVAVAVAVFTASVGDGWDVSVGVVPQLAVKMSIKKITKIVVDFIPSASFSR